MKHPENIHKIILITGGAGYIGSVLTGLLLRKGYRVRVIDVLSFGGEAILGYLEHPNFDFLHGDICKKADVERALEGIDGIVHLAAIVGDPACRQNPDRAVDVNRNASEMLCEKAIARGIRRFVFSSTCSNYGKMNQHDGIVDETSRLMPVSLYAELKVDFEKYLLSYNSRDFEPVCLRFATAYGLSPRPRFDLTVNEFTRELFLDRQLEVYGEQFWRPYCHVHDLAQACELALIADKEKAAAQAFNVGTTDENYRKIDLIETILQEIPDKRDKVKYVHRDEDPRDYRVNSDKIKSTLDFTPTYRVVDGVREIISALSSGLISNPHDPRYSNLRT